MATDNLLFYSQVILNHLDRMSKLVTTMPGALNIHGHILNNTEKDKEEAFYWGVDFLHSVMPPRELGLGLKTTLDKIEQDTELQKDFKAQYLKKLAALVQIANNKGYLRRGYVEGSTETIPENEEEIRDNEEEQ